MLINDFVRRGILGLVFAVMTAAVNAQGRLTVTPSSPASGQTVAVAYSNPRLAGQKITVSINDGGIPPSCQWVEIQLDVDGNGAQNWVVPNWNWAIFSSPDADDVFILINAG